MPGPTLEVADIFRAHGELYRAQHPLPYHQLRLMWAIELCWAGTDGLLPSVAQIKAVVDQQLEACRDCPVSHAGSMVRTRINAPVRRVDSS